MALNESNVVARARRLLVCTIDAANFSDKMDIIFVAEMIEKIGKFVEKFKDVSYCSGCADLFTIQTEPSAFLQTFTIERDSCTWCISLSRTNR